MSNHVLWNKQNHTSIDLMQDMINLHRNLIQSLFQWQTTVEEQARTRYSMTPWSPSRFCKDENSTQQKHKTNINCKISLLLLVIILVLLGIVSISTKTDPLISTTNHTFFCHIHPTPTISRDAGTKPWNQKGPLWNACLSYPASIDTCRGENRDIVDSQILDKYIYIYKYTSQYFLYICIYIYTNMYPVSWNVHT